MSQPLFNVLPPGRCENLRWKGLFVDPSQTSADSNDHIFWCHTTQLVLGPDGGLVDKHECNPGRSCYRAL